MSTKKDIPLLSAAAEGGPALDAAAEGNAGLGSIMGPISPTTAITRIPRPVSVKLKLLTLFNIICVVYTHSYNGYPRVVNSDSVPTPGDWATFIEFLCVGGLLRFAVPMFFCFSGYLFFVHRPEDTPAFQFKRRIVSRCKSVLLPYLLWNVIAAVLVILAMQSETVVYYWPWQQHWLSVTWQTVFNTLLYPVPYQLWYLRDLFLLALLTPVFLALFRATSRGGYHHQSFLSRLPAGFGLLLVPALAIGPWFLAKWPLAGWCVSTVCPSWYILDLDGLMYFPLGCWLALSGYSMTHTISGWQLGLLSGAWIAVNVAKTAWAFRITPYSDEDRTPLTVLFKVGVLLGVPAIWFLYDRVAGWLEGTAFWRVSIAFSPYAMWVYCAHEPMFGMVLELLQAGTGMCVVVYPGNVSVPDRFKQYCKHDANPAWFLLLYLIGGAVWMAALLGLGVALGRCSPRAFQWLTGGRGGKAKKSRRPPPSATAGSEEATARSDANAHVGAVATAA